MRLSRASSVWSTWLTRATHKFRASHFAASVAALSGATVIGGGIVMVTSPMITRLYSPVEFGALGIYASTIGLVVVVAALRYEFAIPYPSGEQEARAVLFVALITIGLTSSGFVFLIVTGLPRLIPSLSVGLPGNLIWWLPLGMWTSASYATLSIWMVRTREFRVLGQTRITQGILQAGTQITLGLFRIGSSGLIVGQIVGSTAGVTQLWLRLRRGVPHLFDGLSSRTLVRAALDHRRFPLYSAPAALLDALTGIMPLFFMAAQFGATAAGLLTLVQRVLTTPFALLTVNFGQVVFGDFAELRRADPGSLMSMFRRRLAQIALIGLALILPMLILVPLVLPKLFGQRWSGASVYFLILTPLIYAGFVSSPFGYLVDVLRRQDLHLLRELLRLLIMAVSLAISIYTHAGWAVSLGIISLAGTVNGVVYLAVSWYAIASHMGRIEMAVATMGPQPLIQDLV